MNQPTQDLDRTIGDRLVVWLAQGLGVGRSPVAPGTVGSVLGVGFFLGLLIPGSLAAFLGGWLTVTAASVWICGRAERVLGRKDPGSVVLDEIVALPLCFFGWTVWLLMERGTFPVPLDFLTGRGLFGTLAVFAGFRFFDVAKPWPIGPAQRLPDGWGVVADDLVAGFVVALLSLLVIRVGGF